MEPSKIQLKVVKSVTSSGSNCSYCFTRSWQNQLNLIRNLKRVDIVLLSVGRVLHAWVSVFLHVQTAQRDKNDECAVKRTASVIKPSTKLNSRAEIDWILLRALTWVEYHNPVPWCCPSSAKYNYACSKCSPTLLLLDCMGAKPPNHRAQFWKR